ncbi:class I SAM-dependent methyltransferase [Candidatus Thiodictyon syntrophicum]|jgi:hypothetical protein|uniref:Methyltransferase domain-containing protein n=1 Tax=Candidatus Thiodictyon syntrophicum TaxID=1166950 RepID=A0A2K8UG60_9GAMM|nr:class I SAM-dependent methyltransferase [Candidatus Thiodictyon syntrophicum]AUB84540.1 hypothetical protein THSYN_28820 [Candidatus Thiodictyon syntrophicum]
MLDQMRRWLLKMGLPQPAKATHAATDIKEIFSSIYHNNYWGNADSRSGAGSDLTQTQAIRQQLPALLQQWQIRSMIDVPCGDFHWMAQVDLEVDYLGADVVPDLIKRNTEVFGGQRRDFVVLDVVADALPRADLIFSRDLLVHFSFRDIARALRRMQDSGTTYLLTTTFTNREQNLDIATGLWRPLNLVKAPFLFPEPLALLNENCTEGDGSWGDKSLALWRFADLPVSDFAARCDSL